MALTDFGILYAQNHAYNLHLQQQNVLASYSMGLNTSSPFQSVLSRYAHNLADKGREVYQNAREQARMFNELLIKNFLPMQPNFQPINNSKADLFRRI